MVTLDEVAAYAQTLPETTIGASWNRRTWGVRDKGYIWERPLTKADIKRYGDRALPQGDLLGVRVENLDAKDALLSMALPGFFTIEHFNGFPAVLIELRLARLEDVRRAIFDAWRTRATPAMIEAFDAGAPAPAAKPKAKAKAKSAAKPKARAKPAAKAKAQPKAKAKAKPKAQRRRR